MGTKRSVILVGRHAEAPKKPDGKGSIDIITDKAVGEMYCYGAGLLDKLPTITYNTTFLRYSPRMRTWYTGIAILAGVFSCETKLPPPVGVKAIEEQGQLLSTRGVELKDDSDIDVRKETMNMEIYARDGVAPVVDYWLNNPNATLHEGKPIEPYTQLKARLMKSMDILLQGIKTGKNFGVVESHSGLVETIILTLMGTTKTPPTSINEIGGAVGFGECAHIIIEQSGLVYTARMEFRSNTYTVDLDKI